MSASPVTRPLELRKSGERVKRWLPRAEVHGIAPLPGRGVVFGVRADF